MEYYRIDELRNILALLAIELMLTMPGVKRRRNFEIRLPLGIAACCLYSQLYHFVRMSFALCNTFSWIGTFSVGWYLSVVGVTVLVIYSCFDLYPFELIWIALTTYAAQHLAYATVSECLMGSMLTPEHFWERLGVYILVAAAIDIVLFFVFRPYIERQKHLIFVRSGKACAAQGLILLIFLTTTFLNQHISQMNASISPLIAATDAVNCMLVLVVQYLSIHTNQVSLEKAAVEKRLETEKKQYSAFKNAVDYINIKCHDLKREIRAMERKGSVDESSFQEIVDQIAVYESFARTGNETLDSLLTDTNMQCVQKGISLSCIADASGLGKMEDRDLYALFGNMLDNAMECVEQISDPEKRFIRLFVKPQGAMTVIHQENGFEGKLDIQNGLPRTTKGDTVYHGFGMRSMRRIFHKYGGEIRISASDGTFRIDGMIAPE